jgi:hypothetical protein
MELQDVLPYKPVVTLATPTTRLQIMDASLELLIRDEHLLNRMFKESAGSIPNVYESIRFKKIRRLPQTVAKQSEDQRKHVLERFGSDERRQLRRSGPVPMSKRCQVPIDICLNGFLNLYHRT